MTFHTNKETHLEMSNSSHQKCSMFKIQKKKDNKTLQFQQPLQIISEEGKKGGRNETLKRFCLRRVLLLASEFPPTNTRMLGSILSSNSLQKPRTEKWYALGKASLIFLKVMYLVGKCLVMGRKQGAYFLVRVLCITYFHSSLIILPLMNHQ